MTESRLSTQQAIVRRAVSMDNSSANRLLTRSSYNHSPAPNLPNTKHLRNSSHIPKRSHNSSCSPGYSFPRKTRFDCDIYEKFKRKSNSEMSPIFTKNIKSKNSGISKKKIKLDSLEAKLEKIKKFNESETIKEKLNRITRSNIFKEMKDIKQKKIDEKFTRYFLRKNQHVVDKIRITWTTFIATAYFAFVTRRVMIKRRSLKVRSARKIIWLLGVAKVLGKFKLKIKKIRRVLAFRVIIIQTISRNIVNVKKWIKKRRVKHAKQITEYFENFIENDLISSVMFYWKEKVIYD